MNDQGSPSPAVEALQRFYAAEAHYVASGGDDFAPVADTLDPEIVMVQAESLPFGGEWRGHEAFEAWMKAFGKAWSSATAQDVRFIERDETVVVDLPLAFLVAERFAQTVAAGYGDDDLAAVIMASAHRRSP